ncbi:hypothetical protein [Paraburkholderia terrae]|uniref:hypothetical protein n=1 Tax=Paraburkholderia terrae TaxID=311230 RepID=UPI001EE37FC5|nr:hypothetical protein [Paraburkholderia terrae]GJH05702.1 hypothetical protein CBA19C8_34115 [Paraburkholderia terrae]
MKLRQLLTACAAASVITLMSGCAHDITISGDSSTLIGRSATPINKTVGLVITDQERTKEVVTPGGGGDKVSYKPYRDLELPIYLELNNVFKDVVKLNEQPDATTIRAKNLSYIVTPSITTTSSSASLLTWPPTDFTVTLECTVTDPTGKLVEKKSVTGSGHAEFSEFKRNFGLAAQRATLDAVQKMQSAMQESTELRQ